ncbi:hypothetical protein TIFTF001_030816 [Ficus carica]|uniref:Uncharacterized protein n=1 Tax=Ficus carica TaxID=3494 RepID=A0AA88J5H9_FICCA|nr:hypothetical protein TIFTF001_030816 [Ficus carica]
MKGGVTAEIRGEEERERCERYLKGGVVAEIGGEGERERHEKEWREQSQWKRWVSRERLEAREKKVQERMKFRRE